MSPIVECVPNISEGRDRKKIDRIAGEVSKVRGVKLLDVDPNGDYNRCVITYAGEPEACVEATFFLTKAASEEIDMTTHKGGHPRILLAPMADESVRNSTCPSTSTKPPRVVPKGQTLPRFAKVNMKRLRIK
jgi:glutamate formiminotransferase